MKCLDLLFCTIAFLIVKRQERFSHTNHLLTNSPLYVSVRIKKQIE